MVEHLGVEHLGTTRANCWAWIYPPEDQCRDPCQKREGALARFLTRRNGTIVFLDHESFEEGGRHTVYRIRDEELRIQWIGEGRNANGAMLFGDELESEINVEN